MGKPKINTRVGVLGLLALVAVITGWFFLRPQTKPLLRPPVLLKVVELSDPLVNLEPVRLQIEGDTLFVSYNGLPRIDAYNFDLERLATIQLKSAEPVLPTAFTVTDSTFLVGDHHKGVIAVFDRQGNYLDSFGTLPDGSTRLAPIALTSHSGIVYAADMAQSRPGAGLKGSKHDFSKTDGSKDDRCGACHTPHRSTPPKTAPLWNPRADLARRFGATSPRRARVRGPRPIRRRPCARRAGARPRRASSSSCPRGP